MKKMILPLCLGGVAFVGLTLFSRCNSGTKTAATTAKGYASVADSTDSLCMVQPSWFPHDQTPAPAEGKGSPFDVSSTTNQIFHQWSWNKFLWLTKPDANGNPLFLNPAKVQQVTTFMVPVTAPSGTLVVLKDINQAGSSNPILQTNPDYNGGKGATVYYSIHMNPLMYKMGLEYASMLLGGKMPYTNEFTFPVGSFELKVAWVPVSAIPAAKQSLYYTTTASLSADGGTTYTNTRVALIGMHVVGVVENHPEFIWATFEHNDIAPNYDWKANSATAAADKLLFKKGSTSGIDGIRFNPATKLGYTPYQVFDLFQYGVPRNSDNSFMITSQNGETNFNNVNGINQCVQSQLKDVWKNYFYNGSIWLDTDGKSPEEQARLINQLAASIGSAIPGSYARGSLNCANVTMESFTQTFTSSIGQIKADNLANCFSCHRGVSFFPKDKPKYNSPLYLSHTFQDYVVSKQGTPAAKVEDLKTQDEQRIQLRLSK